MTTSPLTTPPEAGQNADTDRDLIAIVGMAGRFPKADGVDALWRLLREGNEGLTRFEPDALRAAGVPEALFREASYVPVNGALDGIEMFDANFFQMPPSEARITDPQHRVMLELAWNALEHSGHDPERVEGTVGVYVGCGPSSYLLNNLYPNRASLAGAGELPVQIGNNKDYLATRISYKLNLTGPSACITTACSTSLVAVHFAAQALLDYQCDMALAGGASIQVPQDTGYLHQAGGILSPDGHCRAFDAEARGTVGGNGAAIVVLKRLADAEADGDRIHAVIRGSAVNNDGADKAGYTAPSVTGQARVIAEALEVGETDPASIGYIEAHGTGTPLGDPIEIAALAQVFGPDGVGRHIGSVKTNLGHLDEAAGITGLIKTVLALGQREIPPSLHFEHPNPEIDFAASGLSVNADLLPWPEAADGTPRRAGVSSFGIGGTNAHVVLEEAPHRHTAPDQRPFQLLPVSARSEAALTGRSQALATWLGEHPEESLSDTAFTLQCGRRAFRHRAAIVAGNVSEARDALLSVSAISASPEGPPPVIFLCSGQGSQYPGMARALYEREPVFRAALDDCAARLQPHIGQDLLALLYPGAAMDEEAAGERLRQTALAQPALFAIEYAMAALWRHWGIRPAALIGHSLGEYVAACLSGVMDLDTALALVAARGRLMQSAPAGAMLAVAMPPQDLEIFLADGLDLAAINASDRCVVSGASTAIEALAERLEAEGHQAQRLNVSHAFHSALMDPVLEAFGKEVRRHPLNDPEIPYVSNVTGSWIGAEEARDPAMYVRHLRAPVAFRDGIDCVLRDYPDAIFLEIGPGQALTAMVRRIAGPKTHALASLPPAGSATDDHKMLLTSLGSLWQQGGDVEWEAFAEPDRGRVPLPGYPFERARHWVDAIPTGALPAPETGKRDDVATWFYRPTWKRLPWNDGDEAPATENRRPWLLVGDADGIGGDLADRLRARGERVVIARAGPGFFSLTADTFMVRPGAWQDFGTLLDTLAGVGITPGRIVHLWSLRADMPDRDTLVFQSLIATAQALAERRADEPAEITLVCRGVEEVNGEEDLTPHAAAAMGPVLVIPQELPHISCRSIDIVVPDGEGTTRNTCLDTLVRELAAPDTARRVALRGRYRWGQLFEPAPATLPGEGLPKRLRHKGVYLITGGLGRIGMLLAEYLAERVEARLVLIGRSAPTDMQSGRIAAIERSGGRVLAIRADTGNPDDMIRARTLAEEMFGRIDGVIHAAVQPASETYREIRTLTPADRAAAFHAKAGGLSALEQVFAEVPPDFFMLFSSLSAVLGGLGFAAYAGANSVLDATARERQRTSKATWISVNWDGWDFEAAPTGQSAFESRLRSESITPEEGRAAFEFLFNGCFSGQVAVSTTDLADRQARGHQSPLPETGKHTGSMDEHADSGPETAMAALWCAALGLEQVGPHDDFFALNGDSLLGTRLIAQINRHFNSRLEVRALFEHPTVAGLTARLMADGTIEAGNDADGDRSTNIILPADPAPDYPLTHGQKRLWILSQSEDASVAYNMAYNMRLRGPLDAEALRAAFAYILGRHESLRTAFVMREGMPRQEIRDGLPFMLPVRDISKAEDPVAEARAAARTEARRPFDLTQPPLLRAELLSLSADDHVLLISLHHIVCDGLSLNVLMRELHEAYSAFRDGSAPAHPPLKLQYRDFAVWQTSGVESAAMASHRAYWLDRLQGERPSLGLARDYTKGQEHGFSGGQIFVTLERAERDLLLDLCRDQKITLFTLLTAAFKVLLHQASGQDDIIVGTPVAGREQAELEGQIGLYLNNLVLRDHITRRESFKDLLRRVRTTVTEAFAHQSYPFDRLVEDLAVPGEKQTPLFEIMLNLMPSQDLDLRLGDLTLEGFLLENESALFDLNVMMNDASTGLAMEFAYNCERYEEAQIRALAENYLILLRSVAANPEQNVRALCARLGRETGGSETEKADFLSSALNLDEVF